MRKQLLFFLYILLATSAMSQAEKVSTYSRTSIKAGYFGEFVLHPGFYVGVDQTVLEKDWLQLHWDSELGAYFHKWNNNSIFVQSFFGARFIAGFSGFVDVNVGLGYMLSSPNGDVYVVNESGVLELKGRSYTSHMKPSFSVLFGWDGMKKDDLPFTASIGFETYMQTHFNNIMLPHAALRLGVTYKIKKQKK